MRRCRLPLVTSALLLSLRALGFSTNPPTRLSLTLDRASITVGESINAIVDLRDAYNQPVAARKLYRIRLEIRTEQRVIRSDSVDLNPGRTRTNRLLAISEAGTFMVKALHPELREDAAYVRALARRSFGGSFRLLRPAAWRNDDQGPAPPPTTSALDLDLMYSINGARLSANGSDRMKITAFLSGRAPANLSLQFHNDAGELDPNPLPIAAGKDYGITYLTSRRVGAVAVSFIRSTPPESLVLRQGGRKDVDFVQPLKEIRLTVSPPRVPLGDHSEVQVEILDLDGAAILQKEPRQVYLTLESGLADCEPNPIVIPANAIQGQCHLLPRTTGDLALSASSYGVRVRQPVHLAVYLPYFAICFIFLSSAGASLLVKRRPAMTRVARLTHAAGAGVAGLAVCGMAVFGFYRQVPPQVVLHPLGALTVALLVGLGILGIDRMREADWNGLLSKTRLFVRPRHP
jgi:hypothetical protein